MQRKDSERKLGSPSLEPQKEDSAGFVGLQPNVGLLRQLKLFVELGAIRKTEDKSAQQYTAKIRDVHKKLTKSGVVITDHALALIMLRGLPMYRYEGLVLRLARDEEKLSSILVESRLTEEDMRIKRDNETNREDAKTKMHPLDSNVRGTSNRSEVENSQEETRIRRVQSQKEDTRRSFRNHREPLGKKICRSCDDINLNPRHSPKFRDERLSEERRKLSKNGDKENKKVEMCSCELLKNYWILDSGSADHGTFDKDQMEDFQLLGGDICMANGARLSVEGQGSVKLSLEDECGGGDVILEGVRYIPELETNLISMGSLDESGLSLMIKDGKAEVKDGGKVLFTALNEHNVFVVKTKKSQPKNVRAPSTQVLSSWRRFSMSDENEQPKKNRSGLQSFWKY